MQPKRYIVWSKQDLDLDDPFQMEWYVQQALTHGRAEDISAFSWDEIKDLLPSLQLLEDVKSLWEHYFYVER